MRPRNARYADAPRYRTFRHAGCGWSVVGHLLAWGQWAVVAALVVGMR